MEALAAWCMHGAHSHRTVPHLWLWPVILFHLVLPSYRGRGWYLAAYSVVPLGEDSLPSLCEGYACLKGTK